MDLLDPNTLAAFQETYAVDPAWAVAFNVFCLVLCPLFALLLWTPGTRGFAYWALEPKLGLVGLPYTLSFLVASVVGLFQSRNARARGEPRRVIWTFAGLGAFSFLVGMEHISWGQQLLHFSTPLGFEHINKNQLLNLHNLPVIDELHTIFLLVTGIAGLIGLRLVARPRFELQGVPSVFAPVVWAITLLSLLEIVVDFAYVGMDFNVYVFELRYALEFMIGLTCLATLWLNGRRMARRPAGAPG